MLLVQGPLDSEYEEHVMVDDLRIERVQVADTADAWAAAGFEVGPQATCWFGDLAVELVGRERGFGIVGWSLSGVPGDLESLDGIPTAPVEPASGPRPRHPNGVTSVDHLVLLSPDLARTVEAFAALGAAPRRERDGELGGQPIRQVFYRLGGVILEVIGSPGTATDGPSSLWGITYVVEDIDAAGDYFGERTSRIKEAVQRGRRITTLRHRDLDLSVRTALISPHVRAGGR